MKFPLKSALCLFALLSSGILHAQRGSTPYPDPKNDAAWPSKGAIRSFPWMVDNRASFYNECDLPAVPKTVTVERLWRDGKTPRSRVSWRRFAIRIMLPSGAAPVWIG